MRISGFLFLSAALMAAPCFGFPISFEERDARHFLARLPDGTAELSPDRVTLRGVTLRFLGSASSARFEGLGAAAPSTYIRAEFIKTFPQFPRIRIQGLYRGVDAVFYGNGADLEYDLQLSRGASVERIRISVEGSSDLAIDDNGSLTIRTAAGVVRQIRPRAFQTGQEIDARYVLLGGNKVGLRLGKHDRRGRLTIDPVLAYVKTFGQAGSNIANQVATDAQGNIYAAGQSYGGNFPTTPGSFDPSPVPILRVLSNAGQTVAPLQITGSNVGAVGATPDGGILYAQTSRGILLSVDGGSTWTPTAPLPIPGGPTNSSPSVTVNAFSIDPLDPSTILVATTVGLFSTDSAGQLWGGRNTGLNVSASGYVSVASAFYNPDNPLIAYAVTSGPSYLFASSDAGNTWTRLSPAYPDEPPAPTFSFSPNLVATITPDGSTLYSINGNGTLGKSLDGGNTWIKLTPGFFAPLSMQVDPGNPATLWVLDYRGLHKSTDGGQSFADVTVPISGRTLAVDASGAVYVGGPSPQIYVSADGGQTFSPVPGLPGWTSATLSVSGNNVYAGTYSPPIQFVIKLDPSGQSILYSTFIGGSSGDFINGLAVDAQGSAVLAGTMISPDFPLTTPASSPPGQGKTDGFVTKLSPDGTGLIYSIAEAGSKSVTLQAVSLDSSGAVFVTGQSYGADFPTSANAFQSTVSSAQCTRPSPIIFGPPIPLGNVFVSKIGADGKSPVYTTFLTGSCGSYSYGITTDAAGDAIVTGFTPSPDFPVSANSYQSTFPGPVDKTGPGGLLNAGFVSKISPAGDKLLASTFLGGGYSTQATSAVPDASGNVYVTGFTQGFATGATPGAYQIKFADTCAPPVAIGPSQPYTGTGDAFALKLDAAFSMASFLTYLGGSCNDSGSHIALDPSGNVWISGTTTSPDFPLKSPFQGSGIPSTPIAGFVSELNGDGSQLLFSSLSQGTAMAVGQGSVYVAGASGSSAWLAKIDAMKTPAVIIDSVLPVVAFPQQPIEPVYNTVAPGQLIQISGRNLGPTNKVSAQMDASGRLPFVVANTVVFFDNVPAPLLSIGASAIMCFVPFEAVSGAEITVASNGQLSNAVKMGVVPSAPQVLSIVNQDGTLNSPDHPAKAGSVITIYVSGLGQTSPPGDDGLLNANPLPVPLAAVRVYFPATPYTFTPQFVGAAGGMIAGITQVNVQVPATVPVSGATSPIEIEVNFVGAKLYTSQ